MKCQAILFFALFSFTQIAAQHTFSIVAVDSITGEIGSAGATCGDSIIWPGTPGAYIISEVIPGLGAIHTQSYWNPYNQAFARAQLEDGLSPDEVITWLQENDHEGNPSIRQYGIVDYNGGHPRSAGFTGSNCFDYKEHVTGPGYAIQGNILLGPEIIDSMEAAFLNTEGCLAERLMACLQGANVPGADARCLNEGVSSLSAFVRVGKPENTVTNLWLDLNVAGTAFGVEPIDVLQEKYDTWKENNNYDCPDPVSSVFDDKKETAWVVYPNPNSGQFTLEVYEPGVTSVTISNIFGHSIYSDVVLGTNKMQIDLDGACPGMYILQFYKGDERWASEKIVYGSH